MCTSMSIPLHPEVAMCTSMSIPLRPEVAMCTSMSIPLRHEGVMSSQPRAAPWVWQAYNYRPEGAKAF